MAIKKFYVVVDDVGTTRWYKDAKCSIRHRENGPAQEWNGAKFWYQNGQYHRTDGPAIERSTGHHRWFINGVGVSESEFLAATQPAVELTVADIEKLVSKRVKIVK